jgi:hypothetical protein
MRACDEVIHTYTRRKQKPEAEARRSRSRVFSCTGKLKESKVERK